MRPQELMEDISKRTDVQTYLVKKVLQGLAASLANMKEDDRVQTPLGIFRRVRLKGREILNVNTGKVGTFDDTLVVRFRSATSLRQKVEDEEEDEEDESSSTNILTSLTTESLEPTSNPLSIPSIKPDENP